MLNYLLVPFVKQFGFLRIFNYISFRAAGAAVTALLVSFIVGPMIIRRLRRMRLHQVIREGTPESHREKKRTPTMGGLIILTATLIPTFLWAKLSNVYVLLAMAVMLWMGFIGFTDDYLKLKQRQMGRKNTGLIEGYPFYKYILIVPATAALGWLYVLFVTFVLTGTSNAVNITDGLDGLAPGLVAIAAATLAAFAYIIGRIDLSAYLQVYYLRGAGELTVFCAAVMGACIGFLWFNAHPAQVFMGDTGSLALGGALGVVAILLKSEFLLLLVGGVFVAEMVSVILQRVVYKYHKRRRGREYAQSHRVFRLAPLHHHFEQGGWDEAQVVVRFWILGILCAFVALSTLKLR